MIATQKERDSYLSAFRRFEKQTDAQPGSALYRLRRRAIQRFGELGFPTPRDEEWRFTNVARLAQTPFEVGPGPAPAVPVPDYPGYLLWFLNGGPPSFGYRELRSDGVLVCSLEKALAEHPELVEPHLARYADFDDHAFTALNTAFLRDGAFVYLPAGAALDAPIYLVFEARPPLGPWAWQGRCLVVAGPGSRAQVVEVYQGSTGVYFTNAVTEIVAAEDAVLDYCRVQREGPAAYHVATVQVQQQRGSRFTAHSFADGATLSRSDLNVVLDGEGCECTLNGLYLAAGDQLIDNHTRIDHARPHCASHELYKGILAGRAHGVFNGKICVHKDAQKTDAKQTNKTLLLSDDAVIDTKPQLEIYADDVKCTHGASIGQLDEEAIFYLRTRGIGRVEARRLLTYAFANEVLDRIPIEPLRAELEKGLRAGPRPEDRTAPEVP